MDFILFFIFLILFIWFYTPNIFVYIYLNGYCGIFQGSVGGISSLLVDCLHCVCVVNSLHCVSVVNCLHCVCVYFLYFPA